MARAAAAQYFVIGAMARDILLTHVHGIGTGLATRDIDFAVAVDDWTGFDRIRNALLESRRCEPSGTLHRLVYRPDPASRGIPLDLIPFGGVEQPPGALAWPPDGGVRMNVAGHPEVLAHAVSVQLAPDVTVLVASLAGLAILKLFAWQDRGNENPKDAGDLALLMRHHAKAGNEDRLYGADGDLLERAGFDPDHASPALLGRDARRMASPQTRLQLIELLESARQSERLALHLARSLRAFDDPIERAQQMLADFLHELREDLR